ncbi:hypothetical protein V8F06_008081 [Rhypophila decipiens]
MFIPKQQVLTWAGGQTPFTEPAGDTWSELAREWANPSVVVATVLMFVGGNVVHEALAQTTGRAFTPVTFSFGWPAYALSSLKGALGEGRLLPPPDYPVKVFNLMSSYYRVNKNWIIGRIVRDHEAWISKADPSNNSGIRIAIFEATPDERRAKKSEFRYGPMHLIGATVMAVQLIIAAIPTMRTNGHEWGILAITALGTLLSLLMGALPQWVAEKKPRTRDSNKVFALTTGNGSRDVMIIKGEGRCPDLECLATLDSPITASPWTTMERFSLSRQNSLSRDAKMIFGRPVGYQITRCVCVIETLGWLLILVSLAGIRSHTWCLIAVGAIGLVHNSMLADLQRSPTARDPPLKLLDTISTRKIMDGLMDLEMTHAGCGQPLLREFFPGTLRHEEEQWWTASRNDRPNTAYDRKRLKEYVRRDRPRSMLPTYNLHANSSSALHKPITTTTTAITNVDTPANIQELNRPGHGDRTASLVQRQHQQQQQPTSPAPRRVSSPPLYHPHHHVPRHHHSPIRTSNPARSPPPATDQPRSPTITSNPRNDDLSRVSSTRHGRNSPTTNTSRRSTFSPPPVSIESAMYSGRHATTTTETEDFAQRSRNRDDRHAHHQVEQQQLNPDRHEVVERTRWVSFTDVETPGSTSSTTNGGRRSDDENNDELSSSSLVDIAGDMPRRPFWD